MKLLLQFVVALGAMVAIALIQPSANQGGAAAKPSKTESPSGRP
jgi:hypothetical protein